MNQNRLFGAALTLLLFSNAWILLSVLYNRTNLESSLEISSRELRSAGDHRVSLNWRILEDFHLPSGVVKDLQAPVWPAWLRRPPVTRDALIVLQLNGTAYRTQLARTQAALERIAQQHHAPEQELAHVKERLEHARNELKHEQQKASRLFAIDAGFNLGTLRQRYPDRSQYAIVPGRLAYLTCAQEPKCARIDTIDLGYFYLPDALNDRYLHYPLETKLHLNVGQALQAWLSAEKPPPLP